ncbi:MAG TPA: PilZ domain-containing protein [Rectinemataceae bacterium]|nr:PilZ domain-containing protein [Rectinemataceae bacterium]
MSIELPLAQTTNLWHSGPSTGEMGALWGSLAVIGVIVIAALIYRGLKTGSSPLSGPRPARSASGFSRAAFRRAARATGLPEEEVRFLEDYAKALGLGNPEFVFRNQAKLDAFFKDVFRYIEKNSESEAGADELKARLFGARERLTHQHALGGPISSSRQLGRNTPLTFIAPGEESYPSVIVAVEPGGLAVEPARDAYGEAIRFKRSAKLAVFFYAQGHQGYQFPSRVVGWERIGTKETMVIAHSDEVAPLPARRHARKEMRAPCTVYRVTVTVKKAKGRDQSTARVENLPYPGTIVDISAGGIGIQSANPLPAGEFIKIEFDSASGTQAAFCKVLRMSRARIGGIMHAQFVRISRRALNAILSYVYGYAE